MDELKKGFTAWLMKQKDEDSPVGDLARDVSRDPWFPRNPESWDKARRYLVGHGVHPDVVWAAWEAWRRYEEARR